MKRRNFVTTLAAGAAALGCAPMVPTRRAAGAFKLNYAPHFGMFKHNAGEDLVDQILFAADQGFTAWEDNGMKGRSMETQNAIAKAMESRGMAMGVFVAHSHCVAATKPCKWRSGHAGAISRRKSRNR